MTVKLCRGCHEKRPIEQFGRHRHMRDGYLNFCKPCVALRQKALYERQRDQRMACSRARYAAKAPEILASARHRYATDALYRARRLSACRGRVHKPTAGAAKRAKQRRLANIELVGFRERVARARSFGAPDGLTLGEWQAMLGRVDGCAYCGSHYRIGIDHVVPLSRGGDHTAGNVVPCCLRCNASKFNLTLIEWLTSHRKRAAVALAYLADRPVVVPEVLEAAA